MTNDHALPEACAVDTVDIERIERLIKAIPEDLNKLFSARELQDSRESANQAASLAARFAAKEACLKLFPKETSLNIITAMDFSVLRDAYGAPHIATSQAADIVLGRYLVEKIQISLTHSATSASAVALRVPR